MKCPFCEKVLPLPELDSRLDPRWLVCDCGMVAKTECLAGGSACSLLQECQPLLIEQHKKETIHAN